MKSDARTPDEQDLSGPTKRSTIEECHATASANDGQMNGFHVALAILTVRAGYVLQHRDDHPGIPWPGHWSLFGGGMEPGERPIDAIKREIREELGLDVPTWKQLWIFVNYSPFWDRVYRCTAFAANITDIWQAHVLGEGQATGVFPRDALPQPIVPAAAALIERYDETIMPGER